MGISEKLCQQKLSNIGDEIDDIFYSCILHTFIEIGGRGARVENDIEKALLNAAGKDFCQRLSEKFAVLEKTFS